MVLNFIVEKQYESDTLSAFLRKQGVSLALIKKIKFLPQGILVDGVKQNTNYLVSAGQQVTITVQDTAEALSQSSVIPQDLPFSICYQDPCCMVIDKPADMPIHPSFNHPTHTLANAFCGYWEKQGIPKIYRAINRLDKNTSGLVLIALDAHSAESFKGKVDKIYTALVQGQVRPLEGEITAPIGRMADSIITRCVTSEGQYAKTRYQVLKQNSQLSWVDVYLETGRTHQIRVHFSHLGHPLLGDDLYGGELSHISRHALHCRQLKFVSPHFQKEITVNSQLPQDMEKVVKII